MPNKGTPLAGLAEIARRTFVAGPAYSLVCYTNAQGSLGDSSVYADLVQPTQANGYAPIVLDGVWSTTGGDATYVHTDPAASDSHGNPTWYATGTWSAPVTGFAIVYDGILQHFADLTDPVTNALTTFVATAGKALTCDLSELLQG